MAINYTNLFEDIGEFVERVNQFRTWNSTDLPAMLTEIENELSGNSRFDVLSGVPQMFDEFKGQVLQFCDRVARKVSERLTHRTTMIQELPVSANASVNEILKEFHYRMLVDSETIKRSVVTLGSVTAAAGNYGDATLLTTKLLDGKTNPGSGMVSHPKYAGVDSELGVTSETMTVVCERDSESDGVREGAESWSPIGGAKGTTPFDWAYEGSGAGQSFLTLNGNGLVIDGEFENFTNDDPDSWDIDAGAATTNIIEETTGAEIKRGLAALKFKGSGAASIQVSQTINGLVPETGYCLAVWVKGDATIAAGTLTIQFQGTGYTAGSTEKIEMNAAALAAATSYTLKHFFIVMPKDIPDDMEIVIKVTGTLTTNALVRFDGLAFGKTTWHGGVGFAMIAGATNALRNDRYTFSVANDNAGVFQTFFRRMYGLQLPSAGSPSIADALATD